MIGNDYIVWNPANVKNYQGVRKTQLLKPSRQPAPSQPMGKPSLYINTPFSTEL